MTPSSNNAINLAADSSPEDDLLLNRYTTDALRRTTADEKNIYIDQLISLVERTHKKMRKLAALNQEDVAETDTFIGVVEEDVHHTFMSEARKTRLIENLLTRNDAQQEKIRNLKKNLSNNDCKTAVVNAYQLDYAAEKSKALTNEPPADNCSVPEIEPAQLKITSAMQTKESRKDQRFGNFDRRKSYDQFENWNGQDTSRKEKFPEIEKRHRDKKVESITDVSTSANELALEEMVQGAEPSERPRALQDEGYSYAYENEYFEDFPDEKFSLLNNYINLKNTQALFSEGSAVVEIVRCLNGELIDISHLHVGQSYAAGLHGKQQCLAKNGGGNKPEIYLSDAIQIAKCATGGNACSSEKPIDILAQRSFSSRYPLKVNENIYLKAGNDEFYVSIVQPINLEKDVQVELVERINTKKFFGWSLGFHLGIFLLGSLFVWLNLHVDKKIEEPEFVQVDVEKLLQKPVAKKVEKPKPKPEKTSKIKKPKLKKDPPKKLQSEKKTTKKLTSNKPPPKNAGGGSKEDGNIKARDVRQTGLLASLNKKPRKSDAQQALAKVSSLDAVTSSSETVALKVSGLAAKVSDARVDIASGQLIETKGGKTALRSGGVEGKGQVAALEAGITGTRAVKGKVTTVLSSKVKVKGGLSRDQVKRVIDAHMSEITYCYESALLDNPDLAGKSVFEWQVSATGKVSNVSIASSSLKSNRIHSCISSAIKLWKFPQPSNGVAVVVSYPFIFDAIGF